MDKATKIIIGAVGVGLILVGFGIFSLGGAVKGLPGAINLSGTTTTYNTALAQLGLYNWQVDAVNDIAGLRINSTASSIDLANLTGASTSTTPTVTGSVTVNGAVAGDAAIMRISTTTVGGSANFITFYAFGCGSNTVCYTAVNASTSAINLGSETYNISLIKTTPTTLNLSTSSSPTTPN